MQNVNFSETRYLLSFEHELRNMRRFLILAHTDIKLTDPRDKHDGLPSSSATFVTPTDAQFSELYWNSNVTLPTRLCDSMTPHNQRARHAFVCARVIRRIEESGYTCLASIELTRHHWSSFYRGLHTIRFYFGTKQFSVLFSLEIK